MHGVLAGPSAAVVCVYRTPMWWATFQAGWPWHKWEACAGLFPMWAAHWHSLSAHAVQTAPLHPSLQLAARACLCTVLSSAMALLCVQATRRWCEAVLCGVVAEHSTRPSC
jgi:hypothetical protein